MQISTKTVKEDLRYCNAHVMEEAAKIVEWKRSSQKSSVLGKKANYINKSLAKLASAHHR